MTRDTYLRQAARRFGRSNPDRMECEHWVEMVRSGETAYSAALRHLGDDARDTAPHPGWCFDRFGMSRTRLPDGRVVCVGGEHEDYYDPDFCIYNDVVVVQPDGTVLLYGYPQADFPPTDFHTATRDDDRILLIGRLGYAGTRRYGSTPVHSLDLHTLTIRPLETGGEAPGWIYGHVARLDAGAGAIWVSRGTVVTRDAAGGKEAHVPNERAFRLDLRTGRWSAHPADAGAPPPPDIDWPSGWEPMSSAEEARRLEDAVARSVAPDHSLFTRDYDGLAICADASLLRSRDDPDLFVVVEGPEWIGRVEMPLRFETFRGIPGWLRAAEGRGEWWWSDLAP